MKGLLIKDFCLMKEMIKFLGLVVIISAFLLMSGKGDNVSFVMGYISILFSFLVMNTISYDEMDKGYSFLMTLPVSRKQYVLEKYIFGAVTGICGIGIGMLMCTVYVSFAGGYTSRDLLIYTGAFCCLLFLVDAMMIPIQIKFGAEKGRYVLIGAIMAIALLSYGLYSVDKTFQMDLGGKVNWLVSQSWSWMAGVIFILFIMTVSYFISCTIMRKKEL